MASKKKKKSKRKTQKYRTIADYVSPDVAVIQACSLLDIAALKAIKSGNSQEMAVVSRGWLEVGSVLAGLGAAAAEEAEIHELSAETEMGFRGVGDEEVEEDKAAMGFRSNND